MVLGRVGPNVFGEVTGGVGLGVLGLEGITGMVPGGIILVVPVGEGIVPGKVIGDVGKNGEVVPG